MREEKERGEQTQSRTKNLDQYTRFPSLGPAGTTTHPTVASDAQADGCADVSHSQRQPRVDILKAQGQSVAFMPQKQENQTFILEFSTFLSSKKASGGVVGLEVHTQKLNRSFVF